MYNQSDPVSLVGKTFCNAGGNCSGEITPLDDWDYTNSTTACLIRSALADTKFEGLTVTFSFIY